MITNPSAIREAYDLFCNAAMKVAEDSPERIDFIARATTLGWILEEGVYVENTEIILKELRKFFSITKPVSN